MKGKATKQGDFEIFLGAGRWFIIVGTSLIILLTCIDIFASDEFIENLSNIKVFSFSVIPQVFKLSVYSVVFGLVINSFLPKLELLVSRNVEDNINSTLVPPLKEINSSVMKDLTALKRRSIPLLLDKTSDRFKSKAVKSAIKARFGAWLADKDNYMLRCVSLMEKDAATPYLRKNNIKDIKIQMSPIDNFLHWKENNSFSIEVDPKVLKKENISYDLPYSSSLRVTNTKEQIRKVYLETFHIKIERDSDDQEQLETILEIDGSAFEYDDSSSQLMVKPEFAETIHLASEVKGNYVTIKVVLNVSISLTKKTTFVCINEETLLEEDDNIYALRTKNPFLGGTIIFEVPQEYNISFHSLCPSALWNPISTTETNNGETMRKISSSTTKWVIPGLYFVAKWDLV